jgi:signal transduction histidine kinase
VTDEELVLTQPGTGQEIVVRTAGAPVRLGDRVMGAVVIATDVTEQRRDAEERQGLLLRTGQAVADRDHVLAVVSHELRNPLNVIKLAATVLKDVGSAPELGQKSIASIVRSADRMERMIKDLLDLSAIQSGRLAIDPRPIDPRSLVEETVEAFEPEAATRGVRLTHEIAGSPPLVRADRDRLLQALANLSANALKVTTRGRIAIRVASLGQAVRARTRAPVWG